MCLKGFSLYIKINSFQNNINRLKHQNRSIPYPMPITSVNGTEAVQEKRGVGYVASYPSVLTDGKG